MPSFFSFFFPFFASDTLGSVLLVVLHFHLFLLYFSVIRVIRIECTTLLPYFPTSARFIPVPEEFPHGSFQKHGLAFSPIAEYSHWNRT